MIYAHRVRSTGIVDPAWPVNGAAVCTQPGDQTSPVAVADGSGGIVIAWQDNRSATNFDVYAQRLLSTGAVATGWPAGGLQLVADPGNQTAPRIATDGAAGAIVAWADDRNGVDSDIYAMRARGTGTLGQGWHHDGEVICNAAGDQQPFSFIADGAGGAVAAWQDPRSADGTSDIYAQKIVSSGAKSWTTNGVAVCTAPNYQSAPALASDAAGASIWHGSTADSRRHSQRRPIRPPRDRRGSAGSKLDRQWRPRHVRRSGGVQSGIQSPCCWPRARESHGGVEQSDRKLLRRLRAEPRACAEPAVSVECIGDASGNGDRDPGSESDRLSVGFDGDGHRQSHGRLHIRQLERRCRWLRESTRVDDERDQEHHRQLPRVTF